MAFENMIKKIIFVFLTGIFLIVATCCTTMMIFDSDSEMTKLPDGRRVLKDKPEIWDEFKIIVDDDIRNEQFEKSASGGRTWDERWMGSIKSLREGNQENYPKYIDYIIIERRRQGLPDLKGL